MAKRCGCYNQADDLVFGPLHTCTEAKDPCTCGFPFGARTCPVHAPAEHTEAAPTRYSIRATVAPSLLTPFEARYMETLDEQERTGD